MPAYKDRKSNTWYIKTYVTTWDGKKKSTTKRGFATKKEALRWETEQKAKAEARMDVTLETFVEMYFNDKRGELKEKSIRNKKYMIKSHIIPFFGHMKMNEISPAQINEWQNQMISKGYSETYLRMIQNQVTALFTHASNIYGLSNNPCKRVKKMGNANAGKMEFWTKEEYDRFIDTFDKNDKYYVIFELLFWTGIRIGELLALQKQDLDLYSHQINIDKTYSRFDGKDNTTSPKTSTSNRTVSLPAFLCDELAAYIGRLYKYPDDERIFPIVHKAVENMMKRHIEMAGVKKIRIHDLRHSHASYLIHEGVAPLIIKERLGHKDIKITLNTYGHLYPNEQEALAQMLNEKK